MADHNMQDLVARELYVLTEVAKTLAANLELVDLLQMVTEKITEVLAPAELGIVLLWDPAARMYQPQAASGPALHDAQAVFEMGLQEGESITGNVFASEEIRLLDTPDEIAAEKAKLSTANRAVMARIYGANILPQSIVAAPIGTAEHKYGVLVLETVHGPSRFSDSDMPFVQALADLIALEIDRARQDEESAATRRSVEGNRLRSEVMATLSHELRTPLAAIKGYATALLLDEVDWPEEKQREFLRLIDEETENMEGMIGEIMDAALIDVGQMEISPQPVRLPRMIQEVAREMQRHRENHRFVFDFAPDFPIVEVDPRRFRQVFRNILDNAIKYSPDGGLVVARGQVRINDVVVSIADQGVGISPEDLIPLFDKYFRVKAPTGYHVAGTGLGLPVSRAIVEAHGGRIWAESKVAEGTTLFFSIPLGA